VNDIRVSEASLPKQKLEPAAVLKQEILDFDPVDSYEKGLRQGFLEADATLAKLNEELEMRSWYQMIQSLRGGRSSRNSSRCQLPLRSTKSGY